MTRVVVTGVGAITPIGNDAPTYWENLKNGVSGAGPITYFDATDFPVRFACEVKGFDGSLYIDRKSLKRMAQVTQFSVAASRQALDDAKFEVTADNATRVGVVVSTGGGGIGLLEEATHTLIEKGPRSINPLLLPIIMPNAVSCLVSIETGAKGPVLTTTLACASGAFAFVEAYHMLQRGEADVILAGGCESVSTPLAFASLGRMGALSQRNDDPTHASRPFDLNRDGFVYGEGAVMTLLETEEHAKARGARIYAEVMGGRLTADAYHITAPDPEGSGAMRAMKGALEAGKLKPTDVDVVFAHGTSTPIGDVAETNAIKLALGEHAYKVAVSATKSMIGHMQGGAGAASALAAIMALYEGTIPPTINYDTPDPACDLDCVPNVARVSHPKVALVNAFGFGGQNVVVAMKRYETA